MTTKGAEMMKEIYQDVLDIGKQALDLKARCEAMDLALRVERGAANSYARQVAHWIGKHDALLEQQLNAASQPEWNDENVIKYCIDRGINAAKP
jgi:hypothetical protein